MLAKTYRGTRHQDIDGVEPMFKSCVRINSRLRLKTLSILLSLGWVLGCELA